MKILVVEDDFISRRLMQKFLVSYGDCDIAVNGREALMAFDMAWQEGKPYDLITLDIMMPEMDGQRALAEIRSAEEKKGISGPDGVKVIMTTALSDPENVMTAFKSQCEAYLIKPIARENLITILNALDLVKG